MTADLLKIWRQAYEIVPEQIKRAAEVKRVSTAFNTNIDAVTKISGKQLSALADSVGLTPADLQNPQTQINTPKDAVRGIIKCFTQGIAEEWLCENPDIDAWLGENLGKSRLQMGGQAGIIANVLATLGVQKVYVHTASHPALQAAQFINADNLLALDDEGNPHRASAVNRPDIPLIHRIIEFDAGDSLDLFSQTYTCPKSNRFIATYDPANAVLKINDGFVRHLSANRFDYMILSGFHCLTAARDGLSRINEAAALINRWKTADPHGIIHLELASTQDKTIRRAIIEKIAPLVDSVGLNEREALEAAEIVAPQVLTTATGRLSAARLLDILYNLKIRFKTPRMQLHFYGMYLTLQDKNFILTPEQNKRGMLLAATAAASKAAAGKIEKTADLLLAQGQNIGLTAVAALQNLAEFLQNPEFAATGISAYQGFNLIAVPTILVEKPRTLVGMGDTISALSLVGAR